MIVFSLTFVSPYFPSAETARDFGISAFMVSLLFPAATAVPTSGGTITAGRLSAGLRETQVLWLEITRRTIPHG